MKKMALIGLLSFQIIFTVCTQKQDDFQDAFTFVAAADMRFYVGEPYRTTQHFLGAVESIKEVGKGMLMISPGDVDPPWAVREVLSDVLGEDYPWYPALGNHDIEAESFMEWLRNYNDGGTALPNIVRKGPPGSEETTFSFDYGNCHFVALNQYYDGKSDMGTDGDVVPQLLSWLEKDLTENNKKFVFVYGHEPIVSIPDMDNGRLRHQGDSLDKYEKNVFAFLQLLLKHDVTVYVCGHSHSTSFGNINGLWQIDVGHARGIEENSEPSILFREVVGFVQNAVGKGMNERDAIREFYASNKKQVNKAIFYMSLAPGESYDDIESEPGLKGLYTFYYACKEGGGLRDQYVRTFWENSGYRKSSFVKFHAGNEKVKVEFYRDDAHGGRYTLRHTLIID